MKFEINFRNLDGREKGQRTAVELEVSIALVSLLSSSKFLSANIAVSSSQGMSHLITISAREEKDKKKRKARTRKGIHKSQRCVDLRNSSGQKKKNSKFSHKTRLHTVAEIDESRMAKQRHMKTRDIWCRSYFEIV